ncbi:aminomethyl transferase family protein [Neorhizobium sp. T25_27]|nr:aminomethyl transferase family protein [Neorhizobium sp. T25_27]
MPAAEQHPLLDVERYKQDWSAATDPQKGFYLERTPLFSSAAAAQDAANSSRMLWSWAPIWLPWEYTSWLEEARSFHDTAYIGDWSGIVKIRFRGADALKFLSFIGTNNLQKFGINQAKHHVQVNEAGKIASQGLLYRVGEEDFLYTGNSAYWAFHQLKQGKWNVDAEIESAEHFVFSVQGPMSRVILEEVFASDLGSLRFNDSFLVELGDVEVRIVRTGITGELGYELHGSTRFGNLVWSKVVAAGAAHGIKQLGVRSQIVSHVEAGIATNDRDFISAAVNTPGAPLIPPTARSRILGSYELDDSSLLFRTPSEVNFFRQVSLDSHDFIGRDALAAEQRAGGPARRLMGLIWNKKDLLDVYATLFEEGPIVSPMDLPRFLGLSVDKVLSSGNVIGCSTSRVYSPYLRSMISLGHLPREHAEAGGIVTIVWGNRGEAQREVRAEVVELPFKPDVRRITSP